MDYLKFALYLLLLLTSIFLILLVLIQRGRGGGLAGALGGMGGYSAFGTRAGDMFTRITIVTASVWILLAMALAKMNLSSGQIYQNPGVAAGPSAPGGSRGKARQDKQDDGDSSPVKSDYGSASDKQPGGEQSQDKGKEGDSAKGSKPADSESPGN